MILDVEVQQGSRPVERDGPPPSRPRRMLALLALVGSLLVATACGSIRDSVAESVTGERVEPTETPGEVCTVLGPIRQDYYEGHLMRPKTVLPTVEEAGPLFPGMYVVDATAEDNETRFADMLHGINAALFDITGGVFVVTKDGLLRLAEDDFPYTIQGGVTSVFTFTYIGDLARFLECAQGGEGGTYIIRNNGMLPTPHSTPVPPGFRGYFETGDN